jgi:hypothetical protein
MMERLKLYWRLWQFVRNWRRGRLTVAADGGGSGHPKVSKHGPIGWKGTRFSPVVPD